MNLSCAGRLPCFRNSPGRLSCQHWQQIAILHFGLFGPAPQLSFETSQRPPDHCQPQFNPQKVFAMADLFSPESLAALFTLTSLELVLGIDNVIFIAILCGRLPEQDRDRARKLGLSLAVFSRILLVLAIGWVMSLTKPLIGIAGHPVTGKDLLLILGGFFLVFKATREIHHKLQQAGAETSAAVRRTTLTAVLAQILLIDVVFSLDSVITAVGMTEGLARPIPIMIGAILLSVAGMLVFSRSIVLFIERHPAVKILALSFLMLIGVLLVAEGFGHHIPKGYIYFAMAFSFFVEMLQLWTMRPAAASERPRETQY